MELAGVDPATHYLKQIEGQHQISYKDNPQENVDGSLDQDFLTCSPTCRYSTIHLARGDSVEPGVVDVHAVAEAARVSRRPSADISAVGRRRWWQRIRQGLVES